MIFPRLISATRPLAIFLAGTALCWATFQSPLFAQDAPTAAQPQTAPSSLPSTPQPAVQQQSVQLRDYSQPASPFPHVMRSYKSQMVDAPNLGNSPRIDSLMRDGKVYLSINDAVALALENNLD